MPRFYCATPLAAHSVLALPAGAARHVQVLRLQPGQALTLFDGLGGEYAASVESMGRSEVTVRVGAHHAVEREALCEVHLALGMPANERMDWLVEKACELGAASVQPLVTAHGVLRLSGERADKKVAHWQAVAIAAAEQCGRNRVPLIHPVRAIGDWLAGRNTDGRDEADNVTSIGRRIVLGFGPDARPLAQLARAPAAAPLTSSASSTPLEPLTSAMPSAPSKPLAQGGGRASNSTTVLSGPEGGLDAHELRAAQARGFALASLGPRVLRAETAALAALMALVMQANDSAMD